MGWDGDRDGMECDRMMMGMGWGWMGWDDDGDGMVIGMGAQKCTGTGATLAAAQWDSAQIQC